MIEVRAGGLDDPQVAALLAHHLAEARGSTPADNAYALGLDALRHPDVAFWSAWDGSALVGVAALRILAPDHGELKSMRTHPDYLRRGVARRLLAHVVGEARAREIIRLSLETGTAPMFDAANRLYETEGFTDGPPFGGYPPSPHNRFMTLNLRSR